MCKLLTAALTFAILTFAPMSGLAAIVETGGGFSIFDNSTNTSTISVTDDLLVDSLSLTLDIAHTWVGDLVVSLTGPGGAAEIMVRTGVGGMNNDGDGSGLGLFDYGPLSFPTPVVCQPTATLLYTFADGEADFWAAADATGLQDAIPAGTYAATGIDNAPVSLNAIFNSTSTQGNWTLSITDAATGDQGILAAWALEVETTPLPSTVPLPAAGWLFCSAICGLIAVVRRRKV